MLKFRYLNFKAIQYKAQKADNSRSCRLLTNYY